MERMFTAGINYTNQKTCNVIYGVVTLPNEPTVTGLVGRNATVVYHAVLLKLLVQLLLSNITKFD